MGLTLSPWYAAGERMPVFGLAIRRGTRVLGLGVVIRTVRGSTAVTSLTRRGEKLRAGAATCRARFNAPTTAAASSGAPSANLTSGRRVKSQLVGVVCVQE